MIIGILAALVIVAYNGIQDRANRESMRNDLRNLSKKLELYAVDHTSYPTGGDAGLVSADLNLKANVSLYNTTTSIRNLVYCSSSDGASYVILTKSKNDQRYIQRSEQSMEVFEGTWNADTTAGTLCTATLSGSTPAAGWCGASCAGYESGWRTWTGLR